MTQGSGRSSDDLCARDDLADLRPDVVVDALSGTEPSCELVRQFLAQGVSVVTANKKMIADIGAELSTTAARDGAALLYSAAVGGSAPMLETLRRMSGGDEIRCIAGILSGTCNYVLDRCAEGLRLGEALTEAVLGDLLEGRFARLAASGGLCHI